MRLDSYNFNSLKVKCKFKLHCIKKKSYQHVKVSVHHCRIDLSTLTPREKELVRFCLDLYEVYFNSVIIIVRIKSFIFFLH